MASATPHVEVTVAMFGRRIRRGRYTLADLSRMTAVVKSHNGYHPACRITRNRFPRR